MKNTLKLTAKITLIFLSTIAIAFSSTGTGSTAGGSKGMTWDEIQYSADFKVDFPVYEIENYNVHYGQLCLAPNDMISTKKRYLVSWKNNGTYLYDYLTRPRKVIRNVCVETSSGICLWEEQVDSIPLEQPVKIYRFDRLKLIWLLDDTRNYKLNNCETYRSF